MSPMGINKLHVSTTNTGVCPHNSSYHDLDDCIAIYRNKNPPVIVGTDGLSIHNRPNIMSTNNIYRVINEMAINKGQY